MAKKQPGGVPQYTQPDDFSSKHVKNLHLSDDPENEEDQGEGPDERCSPRPQYSYFFVI